MAQSGRRGSVTISTNMAGRGTDILLGGNPEYMAKVHARPPALRPLSAMPLMCPVATAAGPYAQGGKSAGLSWGI